MEFFSCNVRCCSYFSKIKHGLRKHESGLHISNERSETQHISGSRSYLSIFKTVEGSTSKSTWPEVLMPYQEKLFKRQWVSTDPYQESPNMHVIPMPEARIVEEHRYQALCFSIMQIRSKTSTVFREEAMRIFFKNKDVLASFLTKFKNFNMISD